MANPDLKPDAVLADLNLQWQDHFHMRDQSWKTVTNTALLFLGVIGLELKDIGNLVMIPAYVLVLLTAIVGGIVAAHHRVRQGQKFAFIRAYEEELGLFEMKRPLIEDADQKSGLAGRIFTARFIEMMHGSIGIVALFLLIRRLMGG